MDRSAKTPLALVLIAAFGIVVTFSLALTTPDSLTQVSSQSSPAVPTRSINPSGSWYAVHFTDQMLEGFRGGPDEALTEAIEQAQLSIEIAAYDLSLWSVRDALLNAHERGLSVRVVIEADNTDREEVLQLMDAGIPVVGDTSDEGWMHNKFVILDRQGLWTGSMNFTLNDAYRNDNNLIWIGSPDVAAVYLTEFEEMFEGGIFGSASQDGTGQSFTVNNTGEEAAQVEVWFSPDDGVGERIVELINQAQDSIHFLAFSFTSNPIADAVISRAEAGVLVQGVFDEDQLDSPGGEFARMLTEGLEVMLDANPDKLHHKLIVIDGRIVITGSYNFSASAEEQNDENVVIIFSEEVAEVYLQEVARVVGETQR